MKLILTSLILANITFAHIDCQDFARVAPTQSDQSNLANAKICKKEVSDALKSKIQALDKSRSNCEPALDDLKLALIEARDFQKSSKLALASEGPTDKVKKRFQMSILDLTYALSDGLENKSCDENEYIEVKAQAQAEILALENTNYLLP